jgi:hypothetical protein
MSEWVSCKEKLPDLFHGIIACTKSGAVVAASLVNGNKWRIWNGEILWPLKEIKCWMPLPNPPKDFEG